MSQHAFHRSGVSLSNEEIVFVCRALISHQLKLLCLRECKLSGKDLHRILKLVGDCSSLQQLTLNVGMIKSIKDVESLAHCIKKNKSLTGLHIHGSELGDVGMQIIGRALCEHPGIVSLDVGDCQLGDMSIDIMYALMLPTTNRPGLTELTLSDNPRISALGWTQFGMCLANCNSLRWLFLDYNPLGDYGAACILVGMSASQSIEVLDMEACGLTEHTGQSILHLVQNHLGSLSRMKLSNNRIRKSTTEAIKRHINENNLDASETASSLTVDEFFSMNSSRLSFSLKNKKRSSRSSSSSSTLSKSSRSSSSNSSKSSQPLKSRSSSSSSSHSSSSSSSSSSSKGSSKSKSSDSDDETKKKTDSDNFESDDKKGKKEKSKNKKKKDKKSDEESEKSGEDVVEKERYYRKDKEKEKKIGDEKKKEHKDNEVDKEKRAGKDKTKETHKSKKEDIKEEKYKGKKKRKREEKENGTNEKIKDETKKKDKEKKKDKGGVIVKETDENAKKDKSKKKDKEKKKGKDADKEKKNDVDKDEKEKKKDKDKKSKKDKRRHKDDAESDASLGEELEEVPVFYK